MAKRIGGLFPPRMYLPLSSQSHLITSPPTHCPGLLWPPLPFAELSWL